MLFIFGRVLRDCTPRFVCLSVHRSVSRSVGWSVGPHFTFFMFLRSLASLYLSKCSSNSNTAPAHRHTTKVAVYLALFKRTSFSKEIKIATDKISMTFLILEYFEALMFL